MKGIGFDYSKTCDFIKTEEISQKTDTIKEIHRMLHSKTGLGSEFLGWLDLPVNFNKSEIERIKTIATKIRSDSQVFIVIGIGGSYLGARAVIEALSHTFYNSFSNEEKGNLEIYFAGNNISPKYLSNLLEVLDGKDISINIISKSGTTTEPAIAFRILREYMEKKYGKNKAADRIYTTTDKSKGIMRKLAENKGYETFSIPDNIGGRYSVLTAVGLLPIAVGGINIDELIEGATFAYKKYNNPNLMDNECYQYAVSRNILNKKGKLIEVLVNYEPTLNFFIEWWKQLFGESEGKNQKGIFPSGVNFTADLHSMGQYIQEGPKVLFETILNIGEYGYDILIKEEKDNIDGLNFLQGKTMDFVNKKAMEGTIIAHTKGEVPNLIIDIPKLNAFYLGNLIYFFKKACAVSGYLMGINPFDQPGVEAYKKNMFALLGKPGQ
jgi:glucose-6-phosphate isomerase